MSHEDSSINRENFPNEGGDITSELIEAAIEAIINYDGYGLHVFPPDLKCFECRQEIKDIDSYIIYVYYPIHKACYIKGIK